MYYSDTKEWRISQSFMKKNALALLSFFFIASSVFSESGLYADLYRLMPKTFEYRDFFSHNPMWLEGNLFIKDLDKVKGKILHSRTETYNLAADGTKSYEYYAGYPIDDHYIVFDRDGTIIYNIRVLYQSDKPNDKYFEYEQYESYGDVYRITNNSLDGKNPYVQEYTVTTDNKSVNFKRYDSRTGSDVTVYRYYKDKQLYFENKRYLMNEKKILCDNDYVEYKINRKTPKYDVVINPIGFYEYQYNHPAEIGKPGFYREEKTEILDGPDELLKAYFANLF